MTRDSATKLALEIITKQMPSHDWVIPEEKILEKKFGWVFFYTTRKHWETKNPKFMVPGNAPLIIERNSGDHTFLPTAIPPDKAIEAYEEAYEKKR